MSLPEPVTTAGTIASYLVLVGGGIKVIAPYVSGWLEKREERLAVEATAQSAASREDDITAQHLLKNERELMELVRTLTKQLTDVQRELGEVKGQLGTALANFKNCEERGDEQDGVIVRLMSRIEILEKQSHPPEAAE